MKNSGSCSLFVSAGAAISSYKRTPISGSTARANVYAIAPPSAHARVDHYLTSWETYRTRSPLSGDQLGQSAIEISITILNIMAAPLSNGSEITERDGDQRPDSRGIANAEPGVGEEERHRTAAEQGFLTYPDRRMLELLDKIAAHCEDPSLNILVVGKTGVGKTTFIQGLFEEYEERTPIDAHSTSTTQSTATRSSMHTPPPPTVQVAPHTMEIDSPSGRRISVHVTDTPGTEALKGVGRRDSRKRYLSEVSDAYRKADIVLYCIRMDDYVRADDVELMKILLNQFGPRLWGKVVFLFTFANRVAVDFPEEHKQREYRSKLAEMKRKLKTAMQQAGISEPIANATMVCEAGHPINKRLPVYDHDWPCLFLVNCLKLGITDNTKAALLCSTWKRWAITTRRVITGIAGTTGVLTGLGLIVTGGVLSSTIVTLPLGVPLIAVGTGISLYSAGMSTKVAITTEATRKDMEVYERIQEYRTQENNADAEN